MAQSTKTEELDEQSTKQAVKLLDRRTAYGQTVMIGYALIILAVFARMSDWPAMLILSGIGSLLMFWYAIALNSRGRAFDAWNATLGRLDSDMMVTETVADYKED